jgi:hypothetical protein
MVSLKSGQRRISHSIAPTLSACYLTAIVSLEGRSDGTAVLPRANGYAAGTKTDRNVTTSPLASFAAFTDYMIVPVATNLNVDLRHFERFCLGRHGSNE